ncbi:MAG: GNAT family N-acetyltransferase [Spirochaetaceae bacterium]|nr:GNAT family N-acetyltransferase [Spirochaetaceae bacterium]
MDPILTEEKCLNAFPALKTVLYKGCIIRFAGTYSNRSNSANPLYTNKDDYEDVIRYVEKLYADNKQAACFKVISTDPYASFDDLLERKSYEKIHETNILSLPLQYTPLNTDINIVLSSSFSDNWLRSMCALQAMNETDAQTCTAILKSVQPEIIVCSIFTDNEFAACGYATIENGWAGFYDIVVKKELRNKGLGRQVMLSLMNEACKQGCTTGYLQVMNNNEPAKHLYKKLGFTYSYSYWYRKK